GRVITTEGSNAIRTTAVGNLDQGDVLDPSKGTDAVAKLARLRVLFTDLATTTTLRDAVAQALGEPAKDLQGKLRVSASDRSLIMLVEADASSAPEAQRRAEVLNRQLSTASDQRQLQV